jgi:hypothetical protein
MPEQQSGAGVVLAAEGLNSKCFDPRGCKLSLGDEVRKAFTKGAKEWAQMSTGRFGQKKAALDALLGSEGDEELLKKSYLAKLFVPGTVVYRSDGGPVETFFVLSVCQWNALALPCKLLRKKRLKVVRLSMSASEPWVRLPGWEIKSWKGFTVEELSPQVAFKEYGLTAFDLEEDCQGVLLAVRGNLDASTIFQHAAKRGFPSMTVEDLKRMAREYDVELPKGKAPTEKPLVELLARWALPTASEAEIQQCWARRGQVGARSKPQKSRKHPEAKALQLRSSKVQSG